MAIEIQDVLTVIVLALLEGILSVDNALVLAILVKPLPENYRKKALRYGLIGAFVFRLLAVLFATFLVKYTIFKLIGGAYLIYLAIKHMFFGLGQEEESTKKQTASELNKSFWKIVMVVELTDIVFSIDSIATAVAFSNKIWVLWFGGIIGIILMRFMSGYFVKALEKYPKLEDLAYQLVFFVGIKLSMETLGVEIEHAIFWLMMAVIGTIGASLIVADSRKHKVSLKKGEALVEKLKKREITVTEALEKHQADGQILAYLYREGYLKEVEKM